MQRVILITIFNFFSKLSPVEPAVNVSIPFEEPLERPLACRGNSSGFASEQQISDKYFKQFGNWQRPRLNSSETVLVNVTFVLSAISDVLERERIVKVTGYLQIVNLNFLIFDQLII